LCWFVDFSLVQFVAVFVRAKACCLVVGHHGHVNDHYRRRADSFITTTYTPDDGQLGQNI
jgi:hypothetical protein